MGKTLEKTRLLKEGKKVDVIISRNRYIYFVKDMVLKDDATPIGKSKNMYEPLAYFQLFKDDAQRVNTCFAKYYKQCMESRGQYWEELDCEIFDGEERSIPEEKKVYVAELLEKYGIRCSNPEAIYSLYALGADYADKQAEKLIRAYNWNLEVNHLYVNLSDPNVIGSDVDGVYKFCNLGTGEVEFD